MNEKILSLVEDKAFFEKLKGCTNADEFADVMTEFGVELNDTDPETACWWVRLKCSEDWSDS